MKLLYKELRRELLKDKVYLILLTIFSCFSSVIFFYCHFSIDGNLDNLNALSNLSINQEEYKTALLSNSILAANFFVISTLVAVFVFIMYFYRYFTTRRTQIGCLKALGFKDGIISSCFVLGTVVIGIIGTLLGLIIGYFSSDILIEANKKTVLIEDIVKSISITNIFIGLLVPVIVFSIIVFLLYKILIWGKNSGSFLIDTIDNHKYSFTLLLSEKFVNLLPIKKRFSLRIALRKPIGILIIILAIIFFQVFYILGETLPLSSQMVYESQLKKHNYNFETDFEKYKRQDKVDKDIMYGINVPCSIIKNNEEIDLPMNISGLEYNKKVFSLITKDNNILEEPKVGEVIIGEEEKNMFGYNIGDTLELLINNKNYNFTISAVAENTKIKTVYVNRNELSKILNLNPSTYNKVLSINSLNSGGEEISRQEKMIELERGKVSNNNSSLINKIIAFLSGTFLIFLALYINFQNNTRDILILSLLGHSSKSIRQKLINIYLPILITVFLLGVIPSIFISKSIVMSLSLQTKDYMPFILNPFTIITCFIYTIIIYFVIQMLFSIGIRRMIKKDEIIKSI